MRRISTFIIVAILVCNTGHTADSRRNVVARSARAAAEQNITPSSGYTYNYMYPYLNNQMKIDLNPGVTPTQSTNPINAIVRTTPLSPTNSRRVVPRTTNTSNNTARAATNVLPSYNAISVSNQQTTPPQPTRRVVARSANTVRGAKIVVNNTDNTNSNSTVSISRCLADYADCMNGYCERSGTPYNRCYCSAKLSQIEAKYKSDINEALLQIARLQGVNQWTDDEMNEYWEQTVGRYSGDNVWANLDNALNFDWSSLESRVRGQNAFVTGHEYCVQHLSNCASVSSNLRDAYRSEIARDCATYEQSLQTIKNAADSVLEEYK